MSLTKQDKQTIIALSKALNICNSEMNICKPNDKLTLKTSILKFTLLGAEYVSDFVHLKAFAEELEVCKIYSTKEVAILFPNLTAVEINQNNAFVAIEKFGDQHQVVMFCAGEQIQLES